MSPQGYIWPNLPENQTDTAERLRKQQENFDRSNAPERQLDQADTERIDGNNTSGAPVDGGKRIHINMEGGSPNEADPVHRSPRPGAAVSPAKVIPPINSTEHRVDVQRMAPDGTLVPGYIQRNVPYPYEEYVHPNTGDVGWLVKDEIYTAADPRGIIFVPDVGADGTVSKMDDLTNTDLADPDADKLVGWDESYSDDGMFRFYSPSDHLSTNDSEDTSDQDWPELNVTPGTIGVNDLSGTYLPDPNADRIVYWEEGNDRFEFLVPRDYIAIAGGYLDVQPGQIHPNNLQSTSLGDPGADHLVFWNENNDEFAFAVPRDHLNISGIALGVQPSKISLNDLSATSLADADYDRIS